MERQCFIDLLDYIFYRRRIHRLEVPFSPTIMTKCIPEIKWLLRGEWIHEDNLNVIQMIALSTL